MMSRHQNLSSPTAEPARAEQTVSVTVHFDPLRSKFPRTKMIEWLQSLPEDAKIEFDGYRSGKAYFVATWKEARS